MDNVHMECGHKIQYYDPDSLNNCIVCDRNDWERISATESHAAINARGELKDLRDTLAELEKPMGCGHEWRYAMTEEDHTTWCVLCELATQREYNGWEKLRAAEAKNLRLKEDIISYREVSAYHIKEILELQNRLNETRHYENPLPCGHEARFLFWNEESPSKCTLCWVKELEEELK